jgi:hypothetical protein
VSDVLDLIILDSGGDDHAVAVARAGSNCAIARLPFGKDLNQLTTFRDWIENVVRGSKATPTKAELAAFGERLIAFTFRDEIGDLYGRLPNDDIRLQFLSDRPEIQNPPWEYLQIPKKR